MPRGKLAGDVPQHGYVFRGESEAEEPLIVDGRQPLADALLAGIVARRDEPAHQARPGLGRVDGVGQGALPCAWRSHDHQTWRKPVPRRFQDPGNSVATVT